MLEAIKKRDEAFLEEKGKGKGKVLASIFRVVREYQQIEWVRDECGDLASDPETVGRVVKKFFEEWMKSRVTVEERWGTKEKMKRLDTSGISCRKAKRMVEEAYRQQMVTN